MSEELIEKIIEGSAPNSEETWDCFEKVMRESAKDMQVPEEEFNDFCLPLSEDSDVWAIAAEISILRVKKAIHLIAGEIKKVVEGWGEGDIFGDAYSEECMLLQPTVKEWQTLWKDYGVKDADNGS